MTLESAFPPDKRVENEIDSLVDAGHKVEIICIGKPGKNGPSIYNGAKIHRLFPSGLIRKSAVGALRIPIYFSYWKRQIGRIIGDGRFDIVHVHDLPLIRPVCQLKSKYGFKIVLDLHENWPGLLEMSPHTKTIAGRLLSGVNQWKRYEKRYVPLADHVIVVIEEARERIRAFMDNGSKITVVSNTINISEFDRLTIPRRTLTGKMIFIYEGGITYHRGLQNVLEAFSKIDKESSKYELRIIGSGSYLEKLRRQARKLGLEQSVRFYGWMPIADVYLMLGEANVALIPHLRSSHSDNTIPHKLFHYIYSGLPVIASDCIPIKRIIEETGCGIIYHDFDTDGLAGIIENILENPRALLKYSDSNHWIREKYNWEKESSNLTEIYSGIF